MIEPHVPSGSIELYNSLLCFTPIISFHLDSGLTIAALIRLGNEEKSLVFTAKIFRSLVCLNDKGTYKYWSVEEPRTPY